MLRQAGSGCLCLIDKVAILQIQMRVSVVSMIVFFCFCWVGLAVARMFEAAGRGSVVLSESVVRLDDCLWHHRHCVRCCAKGSMFVYGLLNLKLEC